MIRGLDRLVEAVQLNRAVADARRAADLTLCTYLLEMREFYRWERGMVSPSSCRAPRSANGSRGAKPYGKRSKDTTSSLCRSGARTGRGAAASRARSGMPSPPDASTGNASAADYWRSSAIAQVSSRRSRDSPLPLLSGCDRQNLCAHCSPIDHSYIWIFSCMFACACGGKKLLIRLGPWTSFLNAYMNAPVSSFCASHFHVAPAVA